VKKTDNFELSVHFCGYCTTMVRFVLVFVTSMLVLPMVEAQELKDFRWEKRLVVGVVDDPVFLAKLKKEISKQSAGVRDRKLFFLIHSNEEWSIYGTGNQPAPSVLKDIRKQLRGKDLALIGLDGGTKARFTKEEFSLDRVFAQIDRMPMRQSELKQRKK
jgi:hypothetical protein